MNPEFKRNLWLEITPARLALMPAVLFLIGLLISALNTKDIAESLYFSFFAISLGLTAGWASLLVISSINNEVTERTWDQQRLSALSPWQMTWGKLLGSTAYAWYGGLLCALVAFVVLIASVSGLDLKIRFVGLLSGVLGSLALHTWLLASRLHVLDAKSEKASSMSSRLFVLFLLLQAIPSIFFLKRSFTPEENPDLSGWWNLGLSMHIQILVLACLFLALGLLAAWRSMAKQLMVRTIPWAWIIGIIGLGVISAGFFTKLNAGFAFFVCLSLIAMAATYFALFTEPNNRLTWQAVFHHSSHSTTRRFLQALPLWPLSWLLAAMAVALCSLTQPGSLDSNENSYQAFLWICLLHCLRDCGIYHFFSLRNTTRKPAAMTLLSIIVLGVLLPGLFTNIAPSLTVWFQPLYSLKEHFKIDFSAWLAMGLHLMVVLALVAWRWRSK